jgi:hypothetical protein
MSSRLIHPTRITSPSVWRGGALQMLGLARALQFFSPFQLDGARFHGTYLREEQATVFTGGRTQVVLGGLPIDIIEVRPPSVSCTS